MYIDRILYKPVSQVNYSKLAHSIAVPFPVGSYELYEFYDKN